MAFRRGASRRVGRVKRPFARTGTARRKQKRTKVTRRSGARKSYSASPMTSRRVKPANRLAPRKTMMQSGQPGFSNLPDGSLRITHREYVKDIIVTSANFQLHEQRSIQPGDASMAPWLARIAANFQTYSIRNMAFHFNSTSAAFSGGGNQALGEIIGAFHDNVSAKTPTNKQQLLQLQKSLSIVVSNNATFPIPASAGAKYIRGDAQTIGSTHGDRDAYDEGIFFLATQGVPYTSTPINIGELWVSYDVVLIGKSSAEMSGFPVDRQVSIVNQLGVGGTSGSATGGGDVNILFHPSPSRVGDFILNRNMSCFCTPADPLSGTDQHFFLPAIKAVYRVDVSIEYIDTTTGSRSVGGATTGQWAAKIQQITFKKIGNYCRTHTQPTLVGDNTTWAVAATSHNGSYGSIWVEVDPVKYGQVVSPTNGTFESTPWFQLDSVGSPCSNAEAATDTVKYRVRTSMVVTVVSDLERTFPQAIMSIL